MMRATMALLGVVTLLAAGCGGGGDEGVADEPTVAATSEPTAEETTEEIIAGDRVVAQGFQFSPAKLEVTAGATVAWINEDDVAHTATAGTPEAATGDFDIALDGQGAQGAHTFDQAGTYAYYCKVHTSMRGEIVVS